MTSLKTADINSLYFDVYMRDGSEKRRIASFHYRFLAEEFIEAQMKKSKYTEYEIIDNRKGAN